MAYANAADCRAQKSFPTATQVSDDQLNEWATDVSGELDFVLQVIGVPEENLPVVGPAPLLAHLKNTVVWGVAARLEGAPLMAQPGQAAAGSNIYLNEYHKLKGELQGLTRTQLISIGLIPPGAAVSAASIVGLGLAGNDAIDYRPSRPLWLTSWPIQEADPYAP